VAIDWFDLFLLVCSFPAFRWGGAPERSAAALLWGASLATQIVIAVLHISYRAPSVTLMAIDLALAVALYVLALRANRLWPMLLAAIQFCGVMGQAVAFVAPDWGTLENYLAQAKWGYLMGILLPVATYRHMRRLNRFGVDLPWSPQP